MSRDEYRISKPGVYTMPARYYHADPVQGGSLSSTGARALLPPSCPAKYMHDLMHPKVSKEFDIGHAAHRLVLGAGHELRRIPNSDYRTNAAKDARQAAYDDGATPLLEPQLEQVEAMAAVLRAHPVAGKLFTPGTGDAEQVLLWRDEPTGVWCRAMVDWLPRRDSGKRFVVDYKTCKDASPDAIGRAIYDRGYHQQAAWYLDGVGALGLIDDPGFVFVFQEKSAPYVVTVAQCDDTALLIGAARNRRAIETYMECRAAGRWPGYSNQLETIPLPHWAEARDAQEFM